MINLLKNVRTAIGIGGISIGLVYGSAAFADGPKGVVVSPNENVAGMSYGDWTAAWWQWVLAIPAAKNPLTDTTGNNCAVGQPAGPVFFLAGSFAGQVTRHCTIPQGKSLFFPIINTECSTAEPEPFHGGTEAELRACASGFGDAIDANSLKVSIDGKVLHSPRDYRTQSPVFNFAVPAEDILGVDATTGTSVGDGYPVMITPLHHGEHTVHFEGACSAGSACEGFTQDVTYHITVQ